MRHRQFQDLEAIASRHSNDSTAIRPDWTGFGWTAVWVALSITWVTVHYRDAAGRAVGLWIDSPTYSYAFLIAPLSIYLIWTKLSNGYGTSFALTPIAILLHLLVGLAWYVGVAIEAVEIQQFCLVATYYVIILSLFGLRFVRSHLAAIFLLLFLVPTGQAIVPLLQFLGAWGSYALLLLIGVPTQLTELTIELPKASYYIAPGCSGLNFVLATIVLGVAICDLFYTRLHKKVLCFAAILAAALVSNPIRIFAIIAVDWATDRTTNIVSDHLMYGWLFFATILAAIIAVAVRFRDVATSTPTAVTTVVPSRDVGQRWASIVATAVGGMIMAAAAPMLVHAAGIAGAAHVGQLPALPRMISDLVSDRGVAWQMTGSQRAVGSIRYYTFGEPPTDIKVVLRFTAQPGTRLVEEMPKEGETDVVQRDLLDSAAGQIGLTTIRSGNVTRQYAICFLVNGRCYANGGTYRKAILLGLADHPQAKAAVIIASRSVQPGLEIEKRQPATLIRAVEALAPVVASTVSE